MNSIPKAQEIYKHFKGNLYQIITLAEHSETGEELVIYKALYGEGKVYARPRDMFMEKVDREKYPEVSQEYRFELQKEEKTEDTIDESVLEFLEADTYEQKLNILMSCKHRITEQMITTMALASDIEISEGSLEERFEQLRHCLITKDKYECSRMR